MSAQRIARAKRIINGKRVLGVLGLASAAFTALGVLVRYSVLQTVDLRVTRDLQRKKLQPLEPVMVGFTTAGEPLVIPALGAVVASILWRAALPRAAGLVLYSLGAVPLAIVLKTFWDRQRPDKKIVNVAVATAGTSFPSGHAMGATTFYGALASFTWIHFDARKTRLPVTLVIISIPAMVSVSRVYLGAHWFSDVVGGSAMGALILIPLVRWYVVGIPAEVATQAAVKGDAALAPV